MKDEDGRMKDEPEARTPAARPAQTARPKSAKSLPEADSVTAPLETWAQARVLDETAEKLRQEGAKHKDMMKRHVLFGAAAGLEMAACALRDGLLTAPDMDAKQLLERYRATRIDYLLDAAPAALPRRRPPKLNVSRVVKGKGGKK